MKVVFILVMICLCVFLLILSYSKLNKVQDAKKEIERQQEELKKLRLANTELNNSISNKQQALNELEINLKVAYEKREGVLNLIKAEEERLKTQRDNAAELIKQQNELEKEKLKAQLAEELAIIQKDSPLEAYKKELAEAQQKIEVLHQQQMQALEKEDFYAAHSIELTSNDKADIALLEELSSKLYHKDALNKLIWTEYIQKPIQALCKNLGADKSCGIYKITNKTNDMAYVGQAIDIGDRWKTHCKTALGIGSLSYLTNKLYKSMHKDGIDNYSFEILQLCNKTELDDREIYWMDFYGTVNYGYNSKRGN